MTTVISADLKNLIANQLGVEVETLSAGSHFQDDLNADPLSMVDLVVNLEEHFKIKIPQEEVLKFNTVGDIANYLSDNMTEE